jgi:site-specific DNA recombinase
MNGIIYCRVSSKEQVEGTSLQSQQLACQEYARAHNISVLKVFVEQGESAKFADRTQLLELIDFCRQSKGKVNLLLVWKVDRLARNVGDHFNIKASLVKYGVRVLSVTEPIDSNPEGQLMETILAGFAQFDNDIRAMRTVQGMKRKLQEGIFPWKPPLGYQSSIQSGEKKHDPDRPDQALFGLLQKAWKEFASGTYTKAEMRRLMESWGIETRNGKPLSDQSLDNLFRNKYYAGILVDPWTGEEYEGKHLPMVSRGTFAKVQQIISRHNRSVPHQKERPEFPLRGLVRCHQCQRYLTGGFSRGRSRHYPYYLCANKKCASHRSYPVEPLHDEFAAFLDGIAAKPELVEKLRELVIQTAEERWAFVKTRKDRQEAELVRVTRQIQELITMRSQKLISDEEFVAQKSLLSEKRTVLEATPAVERINATHIREQLSKITEPLSHLGETWRVLPPPFQRRFERLILPVGFVNSATRTAELGLLFRAFGQLADGNSSVGCLAGKNSNRLLQEIQDFSELFREYFDFKKRSEGAVRKNSSE